MITFITKLNSYLNLSMFNTFLLCIFAVLLVQYHWKRRKLYRLAKARPGPLCLPFIGSAWYFGKTNEDIYKALVNIGRDYESPAKAWLGHVLVFGVWGPKDLETLMNSPHALGKHDLYRFTAVAVGNGLFSAPVEKWKRHRRIITPAFNQKILDGFVETFVKSSDILNQQLEKEIGKGHFDILHYISRCVMDMFCETAMGTSVHAQTTDSLLFHSIHSILAIVFGRIFNVLIHPNFIFKLTPLYRKQQHFLEIFHGFTRKIVLERKLAYRQKRKESQESPEADIEEQVNKRKPFIELLIELSEQGVNFTDEEIIDEVNTFLIGATDTTSLEVSFATIMLGMHPEVQQKVYEEVVDVLGFDRPVCGEDLKKLNYLERIIKETMRLFPAGAVILRDTKQDIQLENCTIPANCAVALIIINTHRDPKIYPDPLKFDPDRFLPEEVAKRHPYSWLPFSGGPRNCIGQRFALMAMKIMLATLIRKYHFSTSYKSVEEIDLKVDLVLKAVNGFMVSVKPRE